MKTVYEVIKEYKRFVRISEDMTIELKEIKRRMGVGEIDEQTATNMQREVLDRFINS
jgi:hypothetical protein